MNDYDVFISFKNLEPDGTATEDSELAQELYNFLENKGLKVFFTCESLMKLGVSAYQRVIDEALDSANVLIVVGTSREHLDSNSVHYEWSSFHNDILTGLKKNGRLFSYIKNMEFHEMPRALRYNQAIIHQKNSMTILYNYIVNGLQSRERHN